MAFHASDFTGDFSLAGYDEWKCDDRDAWGDDYEEMLELEREAYRAESKVDTEASDYFAFLKTTAYAEDLYCGPITIGDSDIPF